MATFVNLIRFLKWPTYLDGTCYVTSTMFQVFFRKTERIISTEYQLKEFLKKFLFFIFVKY